VENIIQICSFFKIVFGGYIWAWLNLDTSNFLLVFSSGELTFFIIFLYLLRIFQRITCFYTLFNEDHENVQLTIIHQRNIMVFNIS
jgi:hypothetical protein